MLLKFDLIIFVYHEDKPETAEYYKSLWAGEPPAPVVVVGNKSSAILELELEASETNHILGTRLQRTIEGGIVCTYFPVSLTDKSSCRELMKFLSLGSWEMRRGPEHVV